MNIARIFLLCFSIFFRSDIAYATQQDKQKSLKTSIEAIAILQNSHIIANILETKGLTQKDIVLSLILQLHQKITHDIPVQTNKTKSATLLTFPTLSLSNPITLTTHNSSIIAESTKDLVTLKFQNTKQYDALTWQSDKNIFILFIQPNRLKSDSTQHTTQDNANTQISESSQALSDKSQALNHIHSNPNNAQSSFIQTKFSQDSTPISNKSLQDFNEQYDISSWRYILVIVVMLGMLVMLYWIRLKQRRGQKLSNITLEQAKILDSKNKIVIIHYANMRYMLGLNPHGIALIDKMPINDSIPDSIDSYSQTDFTHLLKKDFKHDESISTKV